MSQGEIDLKLITGKSVSVGEICDVYPLTINEIGVIGEQNYNKYLSVLTVGLDDMRKTLIEKYDASEDVTTFDILCENCKENKELEDAIVGGFTTFLKEDVKFLKEYSLFVVGDSEDARFITKDTFEEITDILKLQNNLGTEKKEVKKMSPKQKLLLEKRNKGRQMLEETRGQGTITLSDVVSIMGIFTSDIDRISSYTIYQLYNQYERYMSKANYDSNFSMMIAGADSKGLDLDKHWTANLESNQDKEQTK